MANKTFTMYTDPGHGWLKVPVKLIADLGIKDNITGYSYMSLTHVYLEEDKDADTFIKACEAAGHTVTVKEKYSRQSRVREYAQYNPAFVEPLSDGPVIQVKFKDAKGNSPGVFIIEPKRKLLVPLDGGLAYRMNPTTVLDALTI